MSTVTRVTATALVAATVVAWGGWLASGGRLYFVSTPSMGRAAPVGSLVLTRPVTSTDRLTPGRIVVFRPPRGTTPYVHRIHTVTGDRLTTKGSLNPVPDPWVIHRRDVLARAVAIVPALGWPYHWAGWLALGAALLVVTARSAPVRVRPWVLGPGTALLLGVPLVVSRPLVDGVLYGTGGRGGRVVARVVATGVFPVRFSPHGGPSVVGAPGELVGVHGVPRRHEAVMAVRMTPALPWWAILLVAAVCLSPLAVAWRGPGDPAVPSATG